VQEKVLEIILRENNTKKALEYAKSVISDLRGKKVPVEMVIIRTQLQKEIGDYASRGPHVAVAQRLKNKGVEIALKYSDHWGYHLELEIMINDTIKKMEAEQKIKAIAQELNVHLMNENELRDFTQKVEKDYKKP